MGVSAVSVSVQPHDPHPLSSPLWTHLIGQNASFLGQQKSDTILLKDKEFLVDDGGRSYHIIVSSSIILHSSSSVTSLPLPRLVWVENQPPDSACSSGWIVPHIDDHGLIFPEQRHAVENAER